MSNKFSLRKKGILIYIHIFFEYNESGFSYTHYYDFMGFELETIGIMSFSIRLDPVIRDSYI